MRKYFLLAAFICLLIPLYSYAGWIITGRFVNSEGKTIMRRYFLQGNQIKFEQYNQIYSYNISTGRLILVDPENLLFTKTTIDEYRNKLLSQSMLRLSAALEEIPADLKPIYETSFRNQARAKIFLTPYQGDSLVIAPMNDTSKLLGLNAYKYLVSLKGRKKEELFFTPDKNCFSEIDVLKLLELNYVLFPEDESVFYVSSQPYNDLVHGGLVLRRFIFQDGNRMEWQVSKIEEKDIPEYEFGVPSLCKELTLDKWLQKSAETENYYDDYE